MDQIGWSKKPPAEISGSLAEDSHSTIATDMLSAIHAKSPRDSTVDIDGLPQRYPWLHKDIMVIQ